MEVNTIMESTTFDQAGDLIMRCVRMFIVVEWPMRFAHIAYGQGEYIS